MYLLQERMIVKRQPMDWEKISANDATDKQLIQLNIKKKKQTKQTTQSKNGQKT